MPDETDSMDFEAPLVELEKRIEELEEFSRRTGVDLSEEIRRLRDKSDEKRKTVFEGLSAWQRIMLARNPGRPDALDFVALLCEDFTELHGDRSFGDDKAMIAGLARIGDRKVMLIGQRKGRNTQERIQYNFGSPHPEGYRKALAKMKLAEKFVLPVVTLVNTPGAYPGIGAEERGQAWAIAENLYFMSILKVPVISVIIGEGGSGGALGICLADRLMILENAYLSVISPEGCAAILWRDSSKAALAAEMLKLTPGDLQGLGIIDSIIPEPAGGAHRAHKEMAETLKTHLLTALEELERVPLDKLLADRYRKYRLIGKFLETQAAKFGPAERKP
ncbi:MAG TPA: acetyl-CoA carboxylase carboxyltransferase subunit alpha [Planctomycetota bacterium]|nr:acetyl-CoA carboxylase carboxyltransferase subunit alpha [Planctomycetota bacterium]